MNTNSTAILNRLKNSKEIICERGNNNDYITYLDRFCLYFYATRNPFLIPRSNNLFVPWCEKFTTNQLYKSIKSYCKYNKINRIIYYTYLVDGTVCIEFCLHS
uniref:Uncharacterized protein n=1 Tax=viral metagenome TaxID=1070528 RepID=A0A6C0CM79_9ZZZZ